MEKQMNNPLQTPNASPKFDVLTKEILSEIYGVREILAMTKGRLHGLNKFPDEKGLLSQEEPVVEVYNLYDKLTQIKLEIESIQRQCMRNYEFISANIS